MDRVADNPLHYQVFGRGIPLLFVHGFTVDHRLLLPFERVFTPQSPWQRIYVDLPGFGQSTRLPNQPVTADLLAERLLRFIDDVIGDQRFALLGNSFGGQLARHVVAERPGQILGLALLCPLVAPRGHRDLPPPTVFDRDADLLTQLPPDDAAEFTSVAVHQNLFGWEQFRDHALPGIRVHDRAAAAELLENFMLRRTPEDRFDTFDAPSVLITGRQDHDVGWRDALRLLDSYPRMTSAIIDGAGHNAHLDRPGVVNALVADWLDRIAAST